MSQPISIRTFLVMIATLGSIMGWSQPILPSFPDSAFTTYYHQRLTLFKQLPTEPGDIIFLGNSITDGNEWSEMFGDRRIKNRGISGDITAGVMHRAGEVIRRRPAKIFLMIGVNDLARGTKVDSILKNILLFVDYTKANTPSTQIVVCSLLPVNPLLGKFSTHTNKADSIRKLNRSLQSAANTHAYAYVDLHSHFADARGNLDIRFTNDGLHLTGEGYQLWKHLVFPIVYDLQPRVSILPKPKQLEWRTGFFKLNKCQAIVVSDTTLLPAARNLLSLLPQRIEPVQLTTVKPSSNAYIELKLEKETSKLRSTEEYHLTVTDTVISLKAYSQQGLFNGIQTLRQLLRDGSMIDACSIIDWPSFSWRGYMVDVGRNYQSVAQLKQQIDVMATYKLSIFHFHLTEDIAWRLESKAYPQLNRSSNMLRNPGEYYSYAELRDLNEYCKARHITLVPEIDMPGHSGAFKRALGWDMQSDSGLMACKTILRELCEELDVPYIHIGGDEVKVTNKNFMFEIATMLKEMGKKVIAWDPGAPLPTGTYLQMWNGKTIPKKGYPSIDSRHLYLNHLDPFDGVSATFNHIICDTINGSADRMGATLCNWPDRRVSKESDLIDMNAVYPVMLTFAERCWSGGGYANFTSVIGNPGSASHSAFAEFEDRLLDQKALYFTSISFPYVRQRNAVWQLLGPFDNNGEVTASFAPEMPGYLDTVRIDTLRMVTGGTIWLRHFWDQMIGAHLSKQTDSTTWYATRKIWSDENAEKKCWIGFNDLSRSTATDSPPIGGWDNKGSMIWVNGKIIPPPHWIRGGSKGDLETPLTDEGYAFRKPTTIMLNKGWNTILIKAPVSTFKGDWKNPVKWMFTFMLLE